jgi:hypothetical protein
MPGPHRYWRYLLMLLVFSYAFVLSGLVDFLGVLKSARRSEIAVGKRLAWSSWVARGCGKPMRDIDSEHGAEVFHKEKRKRLGVITTRWIQTRERNEALDLMVMCLCIVEMFRGTLDSSLNSILPLH